MRHIAYTFACLLGLGLAASSAKAACNIKDLDCWGTGSKCNIKFINNTGKESGSGGGTPYDQYGSVTRIRVKTRDADGNRVGARTLVIEADESRTDNLDKKQNFEDIEIIPMSWPMEAKDYSVVLTCDEIREVLKADKNCKIFVSDTKINADGTKESGKRKLAYNCGVVSGIQ